MNNTRRVDAQLKTARHSMLSASPFQSIHFQTVEPYVDVQLQTEDEVLPPPAIALICAWHARSRK